MERSKSIVITGASSGIGRALAQAFAADGHRLFICARREEPLAEIAREFPSIYFAKCDVARESDVNAFFAAGSTRRWKASTVLSRSSPSLPRRSASAVSC